MTGQSNDVAMSRIKIFGRGNAGSTGIAVQGESEGPIIDHSTMMGIATGISISTTCFVLLDNCRPNASIDHTHVNATNTGIFIENHLQVAITGNLIYQGSEANPFVGIYLAGAQTTVGVKLTGNEIHLGRAPAGTTSYGMVVDASYCSITGGVINAGLMAGSGANAIGIWLTPNGIKNTVVGNTGVIPAGMTHILNSGPSNVVSANNQ